MRYALPLVSILACANLYAQDLTDAEMEALCKRTTNDWRDYSRCLTQPQNEKEREERRFQERLKGELMAEIEKAKEREAKAPALNEEERYQAWKKKIEEGARSPYHGSVWYWWEE